MRAITRTLIAQTALPDGPAAELGCGGGRLWPNWGRCCQPPPDRHGPPPAGVEPRRPSSRRCRPFTQAHLHRLPWPDDAFALLLALDALDQRGGPPYPGAARGVARLAPGWAFCCCAASACPRLLGPHDAALNTGRRYARCTLDQALRRAGFTPERATYANSADRAYRRAAASCSVGDCCPAPSSTPLPLSTLLAAAALCQRRWLRRRDLPAGLSLYVAARKKPPCATRAQPAHS